MYFNTSFAHKCTTFRAIAILTFMILKIPMAQAQDKTEQGCENMLNSAQTALTLRTATESTKDAWSSYLRNYKEPYNGIDDLKNFVDEVMKIEPYILLLNPRPFWDAAGQLKLVCIAKSLTNEKYAENLLKHFPYISPTELKLERANEYFKTGDCKLLNEVVEGLPKEHNRLTKYMTINCIPNAEELEQTEDSQLAERTQSITINQSVSSTSNCTSQSTKRYKSAMKWSNTSPMINLHHVFEGMINRRGNPTGFHSRPGCNDPDGAKIVRIRDKPNRAGVYTATIAVRDGDQWKEKFSPFFPDSFSPEQITTAITDAFHNSANKKAAPWEGPSGHGFSIQGYTTSRGDINTAFPVYRSHE